MRSGQGKPNAVLTRGSGSAIRFYLHDQIRKEDQRYYKSLNAENIKLKQRHVYELAGELLVSDVRDILEHRAEVRFSPAASL